MYHVYARGNRKALLFRDAVDYDTYITLLGRSVTRRQWRCLSYCLMPNHVHLLIELVEPNLAVGMHQLHGGYARSFNARHGEVGHVFQGRYGAVRITDERQLLTTVGYIAANPAVAGLCAGADRWAWSSHRATVGSGAAGIVDRDRLFACLEGWSGGDGRERYAELIAARAGAGAP
jgi:putative transposase